MSTTLWNGIDSRIEADFYHLDIAYALMWLPFLWTGSLMRRFDLMHRPIKRWVLFAAMAVSYMAWHITAIDSDLYLSPASPIDIASFYICVVSGTIFIGAAARLVSWLPVINYLGQYSLIVLGVHAIAIYALRAIGISSSAVLLVTTLVLMIPAVELIRRYFPRYTAQPTTATATTSLSVTPLKKG